MFDIGSVGSSSAVGRRTQKWFDWCVDRQAVLRIRVGTAWAALSLGIGVGVFNVQAQQHRGGDWHAGNLVRFAGVSGMHYLFWECLGGWDEEE